jgi:hypothetical protein
MGVMCQTCQRWLFVQNRWCALLLVCRVAAGFLEEGSLDTRTYGKRMLWSFKLAVTNRIDFDRLVSGLHPEALQRKVLEVLDSSHGLPPQPLSRSASSEYHGYGGVQHLSPILRTEFVMLPIVCWHARAGEPCICPSPSCMQCA